jgi:hypothetical protein
MEWGWQLSGFPNDKRLLNALLTYKGLINMGTIESFRQWEKLTRSDNKVMETGKEDQGQLVQPPLPSGSNNTAKKTTPSEE